MNTSPSKAPAASPAASAAIPAGLAEEAHALAPELTRWRHELHRIPELSLELPKTSAFVQARLAEMGVPFRTLVDGSRVVALLGRGARDGRTRREAPRVTERTSPRARARRVS